MRLALMALLSVLFLLAGCDRERIAKLEEGISTEAGVRQQFGEPVTVTVQADGSRMLEYPRQPEGWTNYFIGIGADGKMNSLRQVLTEANFAKVEPGMDRLQVRALLGRPANEQFYALKNELFWDWRFKPQQASRLFSVSFDGDGRVLRSAFGDDPRETQGGGK